MTSFPFHYSSSFDPAAGAPRPNPLDGTGKRAVFRQHPTSIPSILFGVLLAHGNDTGPDA
jgi:hypothetical protein